MSLKGGLIYNMGLSYKQFVGILDSDGGIRTGVLFKKKKNKISFEIYFSIFQSEANKDVLQEIKKLFGGGQIITKQQKGNQCCYEYRAHAFTKAGKAILNCLAKNKPIHPGQRHDYLIALKNVRILKDVKPKNLTKIQQYLLINLCYQNSSELKANSTIVKKQPIKILLDKVGATLSESDTSLKQLHTILNEVTLQDNQHNKALLKRKLSYAYMSGFYIGDGSFGVNFYHEKGVLKSRPVWSITDPSRLLLESFQRTLNCGFIVGVGPIKGNCFQYRVTAWKDMPATVLPILDNKYLPKTRMEQFKKFKKICNIGVNSLQTTVKGWRDLVELSYGMNVNANRTLTQEQIICEGISQINNRNRPLYGHLLSSLKKKWTSSKRKKRPTVLPIFKISDLINH
uniref:Homing endonuclease LAGLIDADG domain-containing protein n=1 Tax=Chlamydomonas callosa TaxID=51692 RepID=Q8WL00_9CHLO|nr:putative protein [Chlamydomonas callosa]